MNIISKKSQPLQGNCRVPGDKSISHRAVILASLCDKKVKIKNFLFSEDCINTINALKQLGVKIVINNNIVTVYGVGIYGLTAPNSPLNFGNSGTGFRLMMGVLAAQKFKSVLIGDSSLSRRPMDRVASPLRAMGANIETTNNTPPVTIYPSKNITAINYELPIASAQVKSSVLLCGMYCNSRVSVTGRNSYRCRDHTERMLNTIVNQDNIEIPGDISSASFFIVAACIIKGSFISIKEVGINPTRVAFIEILRQMGAKIHIYNERMFGSEAVADIDVVYSQLNGIKFDEELASFAIDEIPILMIACIFAKGLCSIRNVRELRIKESDRLKAMYEGLIKIGVFAKILEDGIDIIGGKLCAGKVNSFGDHRIAMSFLIAGCASDKIVVTDCVNIATSFPDFVETAKSIGLNLNIVRHEIEQKYSNNNY